jgi:hypothetical protein
MISTARFGTRDLPRSKAFWGEIAPMVGAKKVYDRDTMVSFRGADGAMLLIGVPLSGDHEVGNGNMAGFQAASRAVVDAVHAKALELGSQRILRGLFPRSGRQQADRIPVRPARRLRR